MSKKEPYARFPYGDPRCACNNGKDCWVDEFDPEYACYGIENCPEGYFKEATAGEEG